MRIAIVGAGTAGAFAGAWAKKNFPDATVTQIYSKDIPTIGVGESVTPHVWAFLQHFGVDQSQWMKEINSEFKLSNCFEGWTAKDQHFGFTYNKSLKDINDYDFEKYIARTDEPSILDVAVKLNQENTITDFQSSWYELYNHMIANKVPEYTKQIFATSHHIDAQSISNWVMENISKPLGVQFIEGTVSNIKTNNNGIESVTVEGNNIQADFWLDCTGFNRILMNEVGADFVRYENNKVNSSWVMPVARKDAKYYTRSIRNEYGWQFKISLQHRIGTGIVYSDEYFNDNEVLKYFKSIETDGLVEPRLLKWTPGRLKNPRVGNVFAIGMAAGFVEPMEANALWHTLATVYRAVDTIMFDNNKLFDEIITDGYDDTALFILAHYSLCNKGTNKFWNDMREIGVKENHSQKIYEKYKQNTLQRVSYWYSMFPDFMWAQLAMNWDCDTSYFEIETNDKDKKLVFDYLEANRQMVKK